MHLIVRPQVTPCLSPSLLYHGEQGGWLTLTRCVFQALGELSFGWVWPTKGTGRRLKDGRQKV